ISVYLQLQEGFSCSIPNDKSNPSTFSFTIYLGCTTASSSAQLEVIINGQHIDVSSITPFPITPSTVDRLTTGCAPAPGGSAWSSNTQYNWTCTMRDSYGNPIGRDTLVGRAMGTVIDAPLHMRAMLHSQFLPLQYNNSSNASIRRYCLDVEWYVFDRCTEGRLDSFGISTTGPVVLANRRTPVEQGSTQTGSSSSRPSSRRTATIALRCGFAKEEVCLLSKTRHVLFSHLHLRPSLCFIRYFRNPDFTSLVHHRSLVRHRTFTPIPYTTVAYNDPYGTSSVSLSDVPEATKARSVRMIGSVELRLDSTSPVEMRVQRAHPDGFGVRVKVGPLGSTLLMKTGLTPSTGNSSRCDSSLITLINSDDVGADDDGRFEGIITYDVLSTLQTNAGDQPSVSAPDLTAYSGYMLDIVLEYWTEAPSEVADDDRLMILETQGEGQAIVGQLLSALTADDLKLIVEYEGDEYFVSTLKVMGSESVEVEAAVFLWKEDLRSRLGHKGMPWDFSEWLTMGLEEAVAEARSVRSKHVIDKAEQRLRLADRVDDEIGEIINADSGKPAWDDEDNLLLSRIALACERDPNSRVGNYDKP
ncbi:hypothetical protein FOZ60_017226, partial [Perkinsus olseni]